MEDKYIYKLVIASICAIVAISMFIITDSVYMFNALAQTNVSTIGTNRIINIERTTSSGENVTDNDEEDDGNRIINIERTTSTGENVTDNGDIVNVPAQTNASTIGTNRTINIERTTSSGENVTDVGNNQIMSTRLINIVGSVAVDKFSNIFIADSGNHTILKFDDSEEFITKWRSIGSGDGQVDYEGKLIESLHFSSYF